MDRSRYKILAGDDHLLSLRLIARQLEIMGITNLVTVPNGEEVLKRLDQEVFDIVLLDWVMPVKNGLTVLKECRAQPRYEKVAFVMVSSEAHADMIQQTLDAGANGYIVKPVTQSVFEEKMAPVLSWVEKARKEA